MTKFSLYLGTEQGADGPIPGSIRSLALASIQEHIAREFGGYSAQDLFGGWIDSAGQLVQGGESQWIKF
jgi:hypothetical protein